MGTVDLGFEALWTLWFDLAFAKALRISSIGMCLLCQCSLCPVIGQKKETKSWQKTRTIPQTNAKGNQLGGSMGQKGEVGNDSPCTLAKQVKQLADKRNCETCALAEKKEKGQSYGQEVEKVAGVVACCQLDDQKLFALLTQGQEPPWRKASKLSQHGRSHPAARPGKRRLRATSRNKLLGFALFEL